MTSTPRPTDPTVAPTTTHTTNHPDELSPAESAALAAELVDVPGYSYRNIDDDELAAQIALLPDYVLAASFHEVVDDTTGEEVGFMYLGSTEPSDAAHAPGNARQFAAVALGTTDITELEYGTQAVWTAEDPTEPMSRYQFHWDRHGTTGWLDGPDREALETFLAGYFAVPFAGPEDQLLAAHMVDVDGYAFTNAVDRAAEADVITAVLPGTSATLHYVFDETHMFGGMAIVGPVALTDDELVQAFRAWFIAANDLPPDYALTTLPTVDMSGTPVLRLADEAAGVTVYLWQWSETGVAGWLVTSRPDIADAYLPAFMAAQSAA